MKAGRKKGYVAMTETRRKISLNHSRYHLGKHHSEETKKKMSEAIKGEKHYRWKGGEKTRKIRSAISESKRRAMKRNSKGSYTLEQWEFLKTQYNGTCPACKLKEPLIKLTIDHIQPISKGGSNDISNIQPLCLACNSRKRNYFTIKYEL